MGKPNPIRSKFLKYLREQLPHGFYWIDAEGHYSPDEVRRAIRKLATGDPAHHSVLDSYIRTRKPRSEIAREKLYDSSTIKRKLDKAIDLVLQNLKLEPRLMPSYLENKEDKS